MRLLIQGSSGNAPRVGDGARISKSAASCFAQAERNSLASDEATGWNRRLKNRCEAGTSSPKVCL